MAEATKWACHVLNRCISRSLDNQVPEELWSGIKPTVDYFRVFGCIGYVHVPSQLRTKLDDRSHKCVLLRVSRESKAYRLYDPTQKKIVVSRDVVFDEEARWDWSDKELEVKDLIIGNEKENNNTPGIEEDAASPLPDQEHVDPTTSDAAETHLAAGLGMSSNNDASNNSGTSDNLGSNETETQAETSTRVRKNPAWMQDYHSGEGLSDEDIEGVGFAMYSISDDPTTYEDACKEERRVTAMESEIKAIEQNNTWDLVEAPVGVKPIGVKWVYKTKLNADGKVDKYKARLVVKGYA
ncbi:putative RNA-directed DNA polymerase [Helianthus annuus]|nr:putative RNA-directed DNA polymerase [Helianthus annuus]